MVPPDGLAFGDFGLQHFAGAAEAQIVTAAVGRSQPVSVGLVSNKGQE